MEECLSKYPIRDLKILSMHLFGDTEHSVAEICARLDIKGTMPQTNQGEQLVIALRQILRNHQDQRRPGNRPQRLFTIETMDSDNHRHGRGRGRGHANRRPIVQSGIRMEPVAD